MRDLKQRFVEGRMSLFDYTSELQQRHLAGRLYAQVNPYYYHLICIPWAVIGGLTWKNECERGYTATAARSRLRDFNWLIKKACFRLRLYRDDIVWYLKHERGKAGEGHSHFLIAKQGLRGVSPDALATTLLSLWSKGAGIGYNSSKGTAKIEPFDEKRQDEGVSYVCKREYDRGEYLEAYDTLSKALKELLLTSSDEPSQVTVPSIGAESIIHPDGDYLERVD
jgi:hypothetical protein